MALVVGGKGRRAPKAWGGPTWGPGLTYWDGLVEALVVSRGWEASCMLGELLHTYALVLIATKTCSYIAGAKEIGAETKVLQGTLMPIIILNGRICARYWEITFPEGISQLTMTFSRGPASSVGMLLAPHGQGREGVALEELEHWRGVWAARSRVWPQLPASSLPGAKGNQKPIRAIYHGLGKEINPASCLQRGFWQARPEWPHVSEGVNSCCDSCVCQWRCFGWDKRPFLTQLRQGANLSLCRIGNNGVKLAFIAQVFYKCCLYTRYARKVENQCSLLRSCITGLVMQIGKYNKIIILLIWRNL